MVSQYGLFSESEGEQKKSTSQSSGENTEPKEDGQLPVSILDNGQKKEVDHEYGLIDQNDFQKVSENQLNDNWIVVDTFLVEDFQENLDREDPKPRDSLKGDHFDSVARKVIEPFDKQCSFFKENKRVIMLTMICAYGLLTMIHYGQLLTVHDIQFIAMTVLTATAFGVTVSLNRIITKKKIILFLVSVAFVSFGNFQLINTRDYLLKEWLYYFRFSWLQLFLFFLMHLIYQASDVVSVYIVNIHRVLNSNKDKKVTKSELPNKPDFKTKLTVLIGEVHNPETGDRIKNPELSLIGAKGLTTNLAVLGSIGSGKTVLLESIIEQLLSYKHDDPSQKLGMLALDEKGNFYKLVSSVLENIGPHRMEDLYLFNETSNIYFNVLHNSKKNHSDIAKLVSAVIETTSAKGATWIADRAHVFFVNAISLCRLTSTHFYVTLIDLYRLISDHDFFKEKIAVLLSKKEEIIQNLKQRETFLDEIVHDDDKIMEYLSKSEEVITQYFKDWYHLKNKGDENQHIVISAMQVTLMPFTDPLYISVFSPDHPDHINFKGFEWMINKGKIFCLSFPSSINKIVSMFLKLSYQETVIDSLKTGTISKDRYFAYIHDECHTTINIELDNNFLNLCREANAINIIATQNFVTLLSCLSGYQNAEAEVRRYLDNFRNKLFLSTGDSRSALYYASQCGYEDKEEISISFSEHSKSGDISVTHNEVVADNASLNRSISKHNRRKHCFDDTVFQRLNLFEGVFIGYDGVNVIEPRRVKVKPLWTKWEDDYFVYVNEIKERLKREGVL